MSSLVQKPMIVAFLIAFAGGSVVAFAAERSIMQKGKVFSESTIAIKRGDVVMFVNDDSITHNVMSNDAGNEFNIGSHAPRASTPVTFGKAARVTHLLAR